MGVLEVLVVMVLGLRLGRLPMSSRRKREGSAGIARSTLIIYMYVWVCGCVCKQGERSAHCCRWCRGMLTDDNDDARESLFVVARICNLVFSAWM